MSEQENLNEQNGTEYSTENMQYEYAQDAAQVQSTIVQKERVAAGILGAFLGTVIGAVCIVLLGQFGYIASVSGVIMGVCALKGYQLLGKGISTKGIVICAVLMIVMVYLSHWMTYAIVVADVYEADIVTSFAAVPMLLKEGAIDTGMYYKDLIMLFLFTALGAVPTLKDRFRK